MLLGLLQNQAKLFPHLGFFTPLWDFMVPLTSGLFFGMGSNLSYTMSSVCLCACVCETFINNSN